MRQRHRLCQILILFLVLCTMSISYATEKIFQISTSEARRPSSLMAEKILTLAYARLGISIHFVAVPAARSLLMWNANELDGIAVRIIDIGYVDSIKLNTEIAYEDGVVFTNRKRFQVDGYASLKPYVVGYIAGIPFLEDRLKDIPHKEPAPSIESLFRKLNAGRTDIVVDSRSSLCIAKNLAYSNISILEPSLEKRVGYHYLHQRHKELALALERVLLGMEKDGTIKKIQDKVVHDFFENCS